MRRRVGERPGDDGALLATELRRRDLADAEQMRAAPDATVIDTTTLEIDEVVSRIVELVEAVTSASA